MLNTISKISECLRGDWVLDMVLPSSQQGKDVDWFITYWDIVIRGNAIPGIEAQGISYGTLVALFLAILGTAIIFFLYSRIRRRKLLVTGTIGRVQAKNRQAPVEGPPEKVLKSRRFKFADNLLDRIFNLMASDRKRRKSIGRVTSKPKLGRVHASLLELPKQNSLAPSSKASSPRRPSPGFFSFTRKARDIERVPARKKNTTQTPSVFRSFISNRPPDISMGPKPPSKFKKLFARSGRAGPIERVNSKKSTNPNSFLAGSIFGTRRVNPVSMGAAKPPQVSKTRYRRGGKRATDIKRVKTRKARS